MRTEIELRRAYNDSLAEIKTFRLCSHTAKSFINRQIQINKECIEDLKAIAADAGNLPAGKTVEMEYIEDARYCVSTSGESQIIRRRRLGSPA